VTLEALPVASDADFDPCRGPDLRGRRVLLVGLDASSVREAGRWLVSAGLEVAAVEDAAGALASLEESPPDVVVADMGVGLDALRRVSEAVRRDDGRAVPVVAGCSGRRDVGAALLVGSPGGPQRPGDCRAAARRG